MAKGKVKGSWYITTVECTKGHGKMISNMAKVSNDLVITQSTREVT